MSSRRPALLDRVLLDLLNFCGFVLLQLASKYFNDVQQAEYIYLEVKVNA